MSEAVAISPPAFADVTSEVSTGRLRWSSGGKLQQEFRLLTYRGGYVAEQATDWRDVPTEPPARQSKGEG